MVLIAGDGGDVTTELAAEFSKEGYRVRVVVPGSEVRALSTDRYQADLSSPASVEALHRLVVGREGDRVGAFINLLPLSVEESFRKSGAVTTAFDQSRSLFLLLKQLHEDLNDAAEEGGGVVLNVTAIDGAFGMTACDATSVAVAGTLGVSKTFQREFPEVLVRTVDVEPGLASVPQLLATEFEYPDGPLEIGLTAGRRTKIKIVESALGTSSAPLPVDESSVVLITGGALGITADVARTLAAARPTLILVGRSPIPGEESAATRGLAVPELRAHLMEEKSKRNETFSPAEIERSVSQILKDRSLRSNLASFRDLGARVEYHAVDVRDRDKLGHLVNDLYQRYGRIDGVIHGAGVIYDKKIADKTPETFADVFRTKVDSALHLSELLRPESLRFFVLFSSIAGRFGNRGQTDYSAANETLNKLARRLSQEWTETRVVSINWGPWDAGMVSDWLRGDYAAREIDLIPIESGVRALLAELATTDHQPELVISCSVPSIMRQGRGA